MAALVRIKNELQAVRLTMMPVLSTPAVKKEEGERRRKIITTRMQKKAVRTAILFPRK
jgi:hypothetical protein